MNEAGDGPTRPHLAVSVVVIARNEQANLGPCLSSLLTQTYPNPLFEVLIVDDHSEDGTREIARVFCEMCPNFRLLSSCKRGISAARNTGLKAARHPLVAFTDADCVARSDWLQRLIQVWERESHQGDLAAVGGPNVAPEETTDFRRAVEVATANYWGSHGSVQGQTVSKRRVVDHLPTLNVLYRKDRVLEVGGFDETLANIGEDVDLSYRLAWSGYTMVYDSTPVVSHRWREDWWSWLRNMELYGRGRVWLILKDRRHFHPKFLAPLALLLGLALVAVSPWWPLCALPAAIYMGLTGLATLHAVTSRKATRLAPHVFLVYVSTHLAYGWGQMRGLLRGPSTR